MKLATQLAATKVPSEVKRTDQALHCCRIAKDLEKAGEYDGASEMMAAFWPDQYSPPMVDDLDQEAKGEVLLRVGALAGLLGSARGAGGQEQAKNLITQSMEIFEQLERIDKVAEAQ